MPDAQTQWWIAMFGLLASPTYILDDYTCKDHCLCFSLCNTPDKLPVPDPSLSPTASSSLAFVSSQDKSIIMQEERTFHTEGWLVSSMTSKQMCILSSLLFIDSSDELDKFSNSVAAVR